MTIKNHRQGADSSEPATILGTEIGVRATRHVIIGMFISAA